MKERFGTIKVKLCYERYKDLRRFKYLRSGTECRCRNGVACEVYASEGMKKNGWERRGRQRDMNVSEGEERSLVYVVCSLRVGDRVRR